MTASSRLSPRCWIGGLPPICFRPVSPVPQNGFVGALQAFSRRLRTTVFSRGLRPRRSARLGGGSPEESCVGKRHRIRGDRTPLPRVIRPYLVFLRRPGSDGAVKIACLAPPVALR